MKCGVDLNFKFCHHSVKGTKVKGVAIYDFLILCVFYVVAFVN
jgi:hypothetical protein